MLTVNLKKESDYLIITLSGTYDADQLIAQLKEFDSYAQAAGLNKVLVDAYQLSEAPRELDRYRMGEALAEVTRGRYRVAVLSPPRHINKFMENTAVNRGAMLLVTSNQAEALTWLLKEIGLESTNAE